MEILDEKLFPKGRIPMTREQELNMERCAEFMARMIMKYGNKVLKMALDKAIKYGKEHRKPYGKGYGNYAKSVDRSCRNHGGCSWCQGNRTYKYRKRVAGMIAAMNDTL